MSTERTNTGMSFGGAIDAMKDGECVQRAGWNGKGMFIYLTTLRELEEAAPPPDGVTRMFAPCICMYTAQRQHQPGWLASQPDMLADDWSVVDGDEIEASAAIRA